jgi:hypothetical protein
MPNITEPVKRLTWDTIRDNENADWLVIGRGFLDFRGVNIQDLPQPLSDRCLTCSGVSNK